MVSTRTDAGRPPFQGGSRGDPAPPRDEQEIRTLLADTARSVKVMKASWLRVAINLKTIRQFDLWRHVEPSCESYEDYVFGILQLNRYVHRRMMQAMDYTEERRPELIQDFLDRGEEVDVPSYDTLNQLRRASRQFEDREDDFRQLESRVFDDGVGRVSLKKEIDELKRQHGDAGDSPRESDEGAGERGGVSGRDGPAATSRETPDLARVIATLKRVETELLQLSVSKDARKLLFRLVETLERDARGAAAAPESASAEPGSDGASGVEPGSVKPEPAAPREERAEPQPGEPAEIDPFAGPGAN